MKAKTYKSTNNFTAPQSLSGFGIKVTNGKHTKYLGHEEFNFCQILNDFSFKHNKVAFVPCFSTSSRNPIDKLDLFYLDTPGITLHYATLFGVSQIQETDVDALRKELIVAGLPDYVQNSQDFRANYGVLFNPAIEIWNKCFDTDVIIARGTDDRFILNTFYEKIVVHNPKKRVDWAHLKKARPMYL